MGSPDFSGLDVFIYAGFAAFAGACGVVIAGLLLILGINPWIALAIVPACGVAGYLIGWRMAK